MITTTTATVWHSSAKGRRYFTRHAAIRAEVRSIIYKLYPSESLESDEYGRTTYPGYDIQYDEPERYAKLYRRIKRLVEQKMNKDTALQSGNSAQPVTVPDGLRLALSNAGIAAPESDEMLFATHEKYVQLLVDWVKDRKPFATPAGYVLVPVDLLSELRDFANPEIEKYCEMWEGRRDVEFPAMRKIISDADALLAAAPKSPGSQPITAPGWTGNSDANAALVMLDRIDTLAPEDDDRIEEVKRIIRSLAEPTAPDGWIPVSERMPPSRHEVLVGRWWGEKPRWCCKWATYIPGHPDAQSSGWLIPGASWTPTHWMPLPAAPQEVK